MQYLKQSTAVTLKIGPALDDTDGKTAETGLTIAQADVRLSKNGGNIAQKNEATSCTHDELGIYGCPIDATDTATLGRLQLWVHESGALPFWHEYMVVSANVYDSLYSTDKLQVDVTQLLGTAWLTPGVAGTPDVNAKLLGGTAQTGNDVGGDVNDILTDTSNTLDALIKDIPTVAEFEARSILAVDYVVVGDTIAGVTAVTNNVGITQAAADKVRASVCVTGDAANSIGKILYEIYTNRLTSARAGYLANINNANLATIADISTLTATEIAYLNASISSRSSHTAANIWAVGTRALTDKAGFALSTAGILAIWHQLTANIVTANTIGKLLKDDINATISSRSSHAAADIWSVVTRALTDKAGFSLAAAGITAIWEKNISAFSGAGYAGTYVKTLYDDWINGGRLDNLLDTVYTGTPPTVNAIADQVWDEVLTGAIHNIATSAGRRLRQAADVMIIREETCQAGGGNDEIVFDAGASAVNEFYINDLVILTSGTGVGQQRHIDSYVGSSKTATVNRDWTTNPDATTGYVIKADSTKHVHGFETAAKAEIESEVNDALVALGLDSLNDITAASVWAVGTRTLSTPADYKADVSALALEATLTAMKGATFTTATDSLEAIRNRGDSAWITGTGGDATEAKQDSIIAYVDEFETRLSAVRAGYLDNLSVGAVALASICTEVRLAELAAANLPADIDEILADTGTDGVVIASGSKSGYVLSAAGVDAILDEAVEGTTTFRQMLRVFMAALAGKSTGGGTVTLTFRDVVDGKARITATVDEDGNRTAITLDGT